MSAILQPKPNRTDCILLAGVGDVPCKEARDVQIGDVTRWDGCVGPADADGSTVIAIEVRSVGLLEFTFRQNCTRRLWSRIHKRTQRIGIYLP